MAIGAAVLGVTVMKTVTSGAGAMVALPAWVALITNVPVPVRLREFPLRVAGPLMREKETASPDVEVALNGMGATESGRAAEAEKLMVCEFLTKND